jgi:hypothetical protein
MKIAPAVLFLTACATTYAQGWINFQGRITGGSGDRGKCTIDVVVDGVVEVEVSGINGRMRAVNGAAPQWRRLQCNMAMPPNPGEFRFSPQEGRGRQTMVRQPNQNRGVALVRLEDPDGGSEGYKFDLEWRGTDGNFSSGSAGNGGFGGGGFGNGNNNNGDNGNGGSIFGNNGNNGNGGNGNNNNVPGWNNRQLDFKGRGDGYYRSFRGSDEQLSDCTVTINRNGRVNVQLSTGRRDRITLTGRLISVDRDRLVAEMSGGSMQGNMDIRVDNRNQVQEITMSGSGRDRFDLRWNRR